jgi:dihydroorotate dehydrogenase (NAD+) catalytic subunit
MLSLSTKLANLNLKTPIILGSGIFGSTGKSLLRCIKAGAAAVVTKSISLKPRKGYENPTLVELDHGLLNAIGLANAGLEEYEKELKLVLNTKIPVIASIFGKKVYEFVELAEKLESIGVSALELNFSCPHVKAYGLELAEDAKLLDKIIRAIKKVVKIPVFAKFSSHVNLKLVSKTIERAGIDGIVAINTVKAMKIDTTVCRPILASKIGGYSGPGIKPIGIRCVYELAKTVNLPIIGCGGIVNGKDVAEYLLAGASAVQIGTGIYYRGLEIFNLLAKELKAWMIKNNYSSLEDFRGLAVR